MHLDVQIDWRTLWDDDWCRNVWVWWLSHLAYHCMKHWGFFKMCVSYFFWEGVIFFFYETPTGAKFVI